MRAAIAGEALIAMRANPLRTFLTMLGVIIGVASVILMLAIGEGVKRRVAESLSQFGSNLLIVVSGSAKSGGLRGAAGTLPTLKLDDATAIRDLSEIFDVAPFAAGSAQVVYGAANWSTQLIGTTSSYLSVANWTLASGQAFTDLDVRSAATVAILGQTVIRNVFGGDDPVGKTIRIAKLPFTVIGTLKAKGQSMGSQDSDDVIVIPLTTAQRKVFGSQSQFPNTVAVIMTQVRSPELMERARRGIEALLRQRHRIPVGAEDDFTVHNLTAIVETFEATARIFSFLLGAIAFISLFVGGIGIMNIMLVSVTERTREIGIRVAIGARPADIMAQFLLEALTMSAVGCIVGVLGGIGIGLLVMKVTGMLITFSTWSIALAFGVAALVGVFFGFYPARKAARLNPIDALRYQ